MKATTTRNENGVITLSIELTTPEQVNTLMSICGAASPSDIIESIDAGNVTEFLPDSSDITEIQDSIYAALEPYDTREF